MLNNCFTTKDNKSAVFPIPLITNLRNKDSSYVVLILCIEVDEIKKKIVNYTIRFTYEDVLDHYNLIKPETDVYFYQNGGIGEKYIKGQIPATLNENFPIFLYQREVTTSFINQNDIDLEDIKVKSFYLFDSNDQSNYAIEVSTSNYCLKAYHRR